MKLLNRDENNEEKTNFQRGKQSHSIITPVLKGNMDASHLQHMGGVIHRDFQLETIDGPRNETELGYCSKFAIKFSDLG